MNSVLHFVLGSRADWHLHRPALPRLRPGLHLVGPLAIVAACVVGWPAFAGAVGEDGSVAFGLWVGSLSIVLMAWSFVLALRPKVLEPLFGGLDSMYRVHRWAGALAVVAMFLHTSVEPEIEDGIRGVSKSVAEGAVDLAGVGEIMLYILVGLSLARVVPYRYWRWTHKLLGVPFVFASWHFFTAEKPYTNGSGWGWWFGLWMLAGICAYLVRVVGVDVFRRGRRYRVVQTEHGTSVTRLELEPIGRPLRRRLGQFAFLKLDVDGMSEPHPFTIASAPENNNLVFFIRRLGDWSQNLPGRELGGREARIEGPFGRFRPLGRTDTPTVWIAGGVGITPFLAALEGIQHHKPSPVLLYAARPEEEDLVLDRLRHAEAARKVELHLFTGADARMTPEVLDLMFPDGMEGIHVALCGPTGLVRSMSAAARRLGADTIETEDFDIRQGFGPERSVEIARVVANRGLST
ncbi:MAG: hypothetical protein GY708_05070 [Actinomycetia bacterium]|nr:hypothetical protein [Actinomycetes bacterium]